MISQLMKSLAFISCVALSPSLFEAHFPWLLRDDTGKVSLFFGEGLNDRTYKLPASIAKAELFQVIGSGKRLPVKVKSTESDTLVGLQSEESLPADALIVSQTTFGIHNGSRLDYYTLHHSGKLPTRAADSQAKSTGLDLYAAAVDTDSGVDVFATWKDKPLADVQVRLFDANGDECGTAKTDAQGRVSFSDEQCHAGLYGIMLGHKLKESGKLGDKAYESHSHYLTLTFSAPMTNTTADSGALKSSE